MSKHIRFDTTPWIAGALVFGEAGFGVLGSMIAPPTNDGDGHFYAGLAYASLTLPADANTEIALRMTSQPSAGVLTVYEDTSFSFIGAPIGTYTALGQLYADGVPTGSPLTVTLIVLTDLTISVVMMG